MGRRTLRHKRSLDWFSYSVIGIHWLQSDIIIAEISNAVSWSIDVFFSSRNTSPVFIRGKVFLGTSPFLSSVRSFYRTFWRTQISNNRYVCYKNRDAKPKLRRSNLCYYLRSSPKEMLKGIKQEVSMTNPCRFHLRNRRWIGWIMLELKTAESIGNRFPVTQTLNWSSTKFYQGIGGEDCLDLGGVLSKSRPRSVVS